MAMQTQVWVHAKSGDTYVVVVDSTGKVVDAVGPLHYRGLDNALRLGFDGDPELAEDINEDQDSYNWIESPAVPGAKKER